MAPEVKPEAKVSKIYWAPAKGYTLYLSKNDPERVGQYQREVRNQRGDVVQPANGITFGMNVFTTDDPDVQAIIERSNAFRDGEIILCKNMKDATARTAGKNLQKIVTSGLRTMMEDTSERIDTVEEAQRAMIPDRIGE